MSESKPTRLYVIMGRRPMLRGPGDRGPDPREPAYTTDPRFYGLSLFDRSISDEEFDRTYRDNVKAFVDRADAIAFGCTRNLESLTCPVYDRVGDEWVYNKVETSNMADEFG